MTLKAVASSAADAIGITSLTGDVTATGPGAAAATLTTAQPGAHTWAATQTFTVAPVFTDASGTRTALGLGALATVTPGTGVATALAVNIGTAGSFVVNGGALGTPSSGVGTNLTGTASGLTAGNVTGTGIGSLTSLAIGGATIGADALAWTGTATGSGRLTIGGITNTANGAASTASSLMSGTLFTGGSGTTTFPQLFIQPTGTTAATTWSTSGTIIGANVVSGFAGNFLDFHVAGGASLFNVALNGSVTGNSLNGNNFVVANVGSVQWNGRGIFTSPNVGIIQLGATDAASPVAQTLRVQSVVAGTSNIAGVDWTEKASVGTGTGAGGKRIFQTAPAGSTGTAQNTLVDALTLTAPAINMQPSVVIGNQALATTATDGFLYIASGAGPPTGVPTAFTGRVPLYYDSTNDQLYIYQTAWKQPKTPAGAAIVTWQ